MDFQAAVKSVLKDNYANFSGRASRSEFWWFRLFYILYFIVFIIVLISSSVVLSNVSYAVSNVIDKIIIGIFIVGYLAMFIPMIAVEVRRFHDQDLSGWYCLLFFVLEIIPYLGFIAYIVHIVFMATEGTRGPNKFGPDPLGLKSSEDVFK